MSEQPQQPQTPQTPQTPKSSQTTGLQENIAGMLCYVLGWASGIAFLVLEPNNKNIKFHAYQSILVFAPLFVLALIFGWIPYIYFIGWIIWAFFFILWLYLILMTYQGRKIVVPIAGPLAEKWVEQPPGASQTPAAKQ
jgi:uncharacterized membrane protein